jgi:hypothetical protein
LGAAVDNDKQKQMVLWGGIEKKQQELRKRIEETKQMFNRLLCEYILEPIDICRIVSALNSTYYIAQKYNYSIFRLRSAAKSSLSHDNSKPMKPNYYGQ